MDKLLVSVAKASAIATLRPVELKHLVPAFCAEDFMVAFHFWDVWCDDDHGLGLHSPDMTVRESLTHRHLVAALTTPMTEQFIRLLFLRI